VHIPFCKKKCLYCREDSVEITEEFSEKAYTDYLLNQLYLYKELFKSIRFNSMHIGGGTPSLLSEGSTRKLLAELKEFSFHEDAEKAFEFNPESMTVEKLKVLSENGINKISFGVQSTCESVLAKVGRIRTPVEKIGKLIGSARKLDFKRINVDLILGLKGQTKDSFLKSFREVCSFNPKSIYIYPLQIQNQTYVNSFYMNDKSKFYGEFNSLFSKTIGDVKNIAKAYDYNIPSDMSINNMIGFCFQKKEENRHLNHYEYIPPEPSSCLGVGIKARSRIFGSVEYVDTS
jgi:oxygen-independent coproporphyrinogen-3 oxidase